MQATTELLSHGRSALARGDHAAAIAAFAQVLEQHDGPEAQYGLARAVEQAGDYDAAIAHYERAYAGFRGRGEVLRPALIAARELCFLHAAVRGDDAVAAGWLSRARRLATGAGDCVERGWVELAEAMVTDDPDRKRAHIGAASRLAAAVGDDDLAFCALGHQGLCLVLAGDVDEGMRCVDEAAAAASGGEVSDYITVGEIYCKMLLCCELTLDVRRAEQWMAVGARFGTDSNAMWVSAICRMHYGGILTAAGRWPDAERELSTAVRLYDAGYRALRSAALVRLADLRVRQGRYEEAGRLLDGHELDPYAVRPLARLQLARGATEVAATTLHRHLGAGTPGVLQVPDLAMLAEVDLAAGRWEQAAAVRDRLQSLAARCALPMTNAWSQLVAGGVAAAVEDPSALGHLEAALAGFETAGLPLEAARTRLAIARELAATSPPVAVEEASRALDMCQRLGAGPDADAAAALLRGLGAGGRRVPRAEGALTVREREVLGLVAEGLSNAAIAERLCLSKRTVEHHVGAVLTKLGLSTRAEAIAHALRAPGRSSRGTGVRTDA